jgi:hypothetical protein
MINGMSILDKSGNEINVGDYIVYGHNLGRCAGLKFGKIMNIDYEETGNHWQPFKFSIGVIGVDDDWNFQDARLSRKGTLQFPDRIIVLPFEKLPDYAKKLLKDI